MKMSEAYDRTKKLERMISDLQHSIKSLEHRAIPADNSYDHSIAITTLEAKRKELIEAVAELGNMDVVAPPTPGIVATPEDNAAQNIASKAYDLQHAPNGRQLVGLPCFFSEDGTEWTDIPVLCAGYVPETGIYYRQPNGTEFPGGKFKFAKLAHLDFLAVSA